MTNVRGLYHYLCPTLLLPWGYGTGLDELTITGSGQFLEPIDDPRDMLCTLEKVFEPEVFVRGVCAGILVADARIDDRDTERPCESVHGRAAPAKRYDNRR